MLQLACFCSDMDQLRRQRDAAFAAQEQGQRDVAALKSELATATAAREDAMQLAKSLQVGPGAWVVLVQACTPVQGLGLGLRCMNLLLPRLSCL